MLSTEFIEAFNSTIQVNANNIKTLTVEQQDRVKDNGNRAEALLKNKDLALFIHNAKVELMEELTNITGHTEEDNSRRVAVSNQLSGIEKFITSLQRAVYWRKQLVKYNPTPSDLLQ